jgi:hypothetical protein
MGYNYHKAIYHILTNDATISGLVGNRIFPQVIEQGSTYPCLTYRMISTTPYHVKDGADEMATIRVEITAYATKYVDVNAVCNAIIQAVGILTPGIYNTVDVRGCKYDGIVDGYNVQGMIHTKSLDLLMLIKR